MSELLPVDDQDLKTSAARMIRKLIPFEEVVETISEALKAEKNIHSREHGIVIVPDWEARIKAANLRVQLGGELDEEFIPGDAKKTLRVLLSKDPDKALKALVSAKAPKE
jgi:hypothetical protein